MRLFFVCILIGCCVCSLPATLSAQEFPCDGAFYFVSTNTVVGSKFYKLVMNEDTQTFTYEELPFDNPTGRHVTCIGYNVKDRMIYGLDFDTHELLRIGSDGSLVSLGVPRNLDRSFDYYAGGMTPDGRRLMVVARNRETGLDERMYLINVNAPPTYNAGYFSIVSALPLTMNDIAVDPVVGVTYAFDLFNKQIVVTDITGQSSANHRNFVKVNQVFGAMFFDRQGQLYGLGNSAGGDAEQAIMYAIDKRSGETTRLETAIGGRDTDGCACPYTLTFKKTITPTQTIGCSEVIIDYEVTNRAGIAYVGVRLLDELPPSFNILDISTDDIDVIDVNSGIGSNVLDISKWSTLLRENTLRVTAEIRSAAPGVLSSQARLEEFPLALGGALLSDDPLTPEPEDPTELEILSTTEYRLRDYLVPSCNLDTFFLTLPLEGDFLWSDGSSGRVLAATQPGNYGVTVTTECFVISDSLYLEMDGEPLTVDLGEDRQADLGDVLQLNFRTNARRVSRVEWASDRELEFSCNDCPAPELTALENTGVFLTITDERGCSASDELRLFVDDTKRVFAPNVFSPDGDGVNDVFFVQGKNGQVVSLQIYDRWGNLVFEQREAALNDPFNGWNGMHKGYKAPPGVYLWFAAVRFPDGRIKQYTGDVTALY